MQNKKIFSFGVGLTILALAFFAGVSNAQAADSVVRGNLPNTFSDGVNVYLYNAAQDSGCDGIADGGEVFYGSMLSGAISLDTTYINTDTDYSITVTEASTTGANLYVYFCNNSNNVIDTYDVGDFAVSQTRNVSLGKISNGASSAHADLDNYYVSICTAAGGTQYNNTASQVDAGTNQYSQYYAFEQADDGVGSAPPSTITAMFDSAGDNCTYTDAVTTKKTGYLIDVTSASDNYGIVIAFNPDTKVTGDAIAAADLAAAVFTIYNDAGTAETLTDDTSAGMGFEVNAGNPDGDTADDDFIIYYDGTKIANDIHVQIVTAANGTTHWLSVDEVDFTGAGSYDILVDLSDSGDGVPADINDIQVTCNVASSTAPDDSVIFKTAALHDTYLYDIYMPACSSVETVLFKIDGTTVFTKTAVDLSASATLDVAKITGEAAAGIEVVAGGADNIEIFTGVDCTTEVSSEDVQPADGAGVDYSVYFQDTDATVYMKVSKDADTYTTCGNSVIAGTFDTNQAATVDLTVELTGTVHATATRAAVDDDAVNPDATDASACTAYSNVAANTYYLYTSTSTDMAAEVDSTSNVFFTVGASGTELVEKNYDLSVAASTQIDVSRFSGETANVHANLKTGGTPGTSEIVVYDAANVTTAMSSEDVDMNTDYNQYFIMPAGSAVNLEVQSATSSEKLFYINDTTVAAGTSYTFEPKYLVAATVPAAVLGFEVQQGDSGGYLMRDKTSSTTYDVYVDLTQEAEDAAYDYRVYTDATFATLVLDRSGKDVSGSATFDVNTITNTNVHADLLINDPVTVYTTATDTADCSGTALSSAITQTWAAAAKKYYEKTDDNDIILKVTVGSYVSCINILATSTDAGGDNSYDLDVKTSGNVNNDITTVYIDSDEAGGDDISQATIGTTPKTYAIYWAGDGDSDISFYDVTPTLRLDIDGRNLSTTGTVNVAKVSGAAQEALATIVVYSDAACSSAVSTEVVDPTIAGYTQYFEGVDVTTYRIAVTDATPHTSCFTSGFTPSSQAATVNFDRKLSGSVPDVDDTTIDVLSVTAGTGDDTYWVNTVNPGAAPNTYAIYVDDADTAIATAGVNFRSAVAGGGSTLVSTTKDLSSADGTVDASAAYGNTHTDIDGAGEIDTVCYNALPTSNADCSTQAGVITQPAAAAAYEIFFEQIAATTTYYVQVADSDTATYYSWNKFTSAAAGAYNPVELDGKLSGSVREAFDTSIKVPDVTIRMYDSAGDPETNQVSLTYSYNEAGTTTAPTGNYRMYGDSGVDYDADFTKGAYITQTNTGANVLDDTLDIDLVSGVKVIVREYNSNNLVTDATVSIYACSGADVTTCTTVLDTCTQPSGNCTRAGDNSAGNGLSGEYYFSGIPTGDYIQIKVEKTNYATILDPDPAESDNETYQISAAAVQPAGLATANTYFLGNPPPEGNLTLIGGSGTYENAGLLYVDVGQQVTVSFDAGEAGLTGVADLGALGGSATQALADTSGVYTYTQTVGATTTTGLKSITANVYDGSNYDAKTVAVYVDNTAPADVVSGGDPGDVSTTGSVTWTWVAATDANSGIRNYNVEFDDSPACASPIWAKTTADQSYTVGGLTNGTTYYMCVQSVDNVGNTGSYVDLDADGILVDTTPTGVPTYDLRPIISVNGGNFKASVKANDTVTLDVVASEIMGVDPTIVLGGVAPDVACTETGTTYVCTWTIDADFADTTTPDLSVSGGQDLAGNDDTDFAQADIVTVDKAAPSVTVTAPVAGSNASNTAFTLTLNGGETGLICKYKVQADGGAVPTFAQMGDYLADLNDNTYIGTAVVSADGTYDVYAVCQDIAGNEGADDNQNFVVDTTGPAITGVEPDPEDYAITTQTITITSDEAISCYYATDDLKTSVPGTGWTAFDTDQATVSPDATGITPVVEGTAQYYVKCEDVNGVEISDNIVITWFYDSTNPPIPERDLSLSGAKYLTNSQLKWDGGVDTGSGIKYYTLQIASSTNFASPEVTATTSFSSYTLTAGNKTSLSEGANYWRVQSIDKAGRTSGYQGTDQTFILDKTAPTIDDYSPVDDATGTDSWPYIYLYFVEELDTSLITSSTVKLYKTTDLVTAVPAYVWAVNAIVDNGVKETYVEIDPVSRLEYATSYTVVIDGSLKDVSGNSFAGLAANDYVFTTAAQSYGSLTVNDINTVRSWGEIGGAWSEGWEWVINVTVPFNDLDLALKFSNWGSATNSITVSTSTMRYWSEEIAGVATGTESNPVYVTAANTYPAYMTLTSDGDTSMDGYQTNIHVQVKIPSTAALGSYSASYGVTIAPL